MKKPDRFERMLEKLVFDGESYDPFVHYEDVAKLLRDEHAWMVRMVRDLTVYRFPNGPFEDPYYISRQALLHKLAQRRK